MSTIKKSRHTKTKIIATLGPSVNTESKMLSLIKEGVDVFRLNFSHGDHEQHKKFIDIVRALNKKYKLHICLLGDLQGPKIRTGDVENNAIKLKRGQVFHFTNQPKTGDANEVYVNYDALPRDVKIGDRILLDDGKLEVRVEDTDRKEKVKVKVIYGGVLSSKKGVNLPHTKVSLPSLTDKDKKDLDFALENNIEWIGLSFVRTADNITQVKNTIEKQEKSARVIAKIEKPEALTNIDSIIDVSDGIMVARGDLGVELKMEDLPLAQKRIVDKSLAASKPVIIATQIMESMIESPKPTRAETNDVANAVIDGADALMLSGETSVGKYPVRVVESMRKIIKATEKHPGIYFKDHHLSQKSKTYLSDALCFNATQLSEKIKAKGIVGMTQSGYTGFRISSYRPNAGIYVFSSNRYLLTALNLLWGVRVFYYDKFISTDKTFKDVNQILENKGLVKKNDLVINLASMPIHERRRTNTIKITTIE